LIDGKRIVVVLPAYNAEKTLEATVRELGWFGASSVVSAVAPDAVR
jgi:NifB/MoaA-like Fe-S oxidoreductase